MAFNSLAQTSHCFCDVTLLMFIALRPPGLHPIHLHLVSSHCFVDMKFFCYESVIIKKIGEEVVGKLQSKMPLRHLRLPDVEKQRGLRMMSKCLRGGYLAVGDVSEMALYVPLSILEKVLSQLLFLLSL